MSINKFFKAILVQTHMLKRRFWLPVFIWLIAIQPTWSYVTSLDRRP